MSSYISKSRITWVLAGIGFLLGSFVSWGILSGDEQGRVNILYLLFVYLLLPLASVLISTLSLLFGGGFNLAQCLSRVPLWSTEQQQVWRKLRQDKFDSLWFFHSAQIVAICFSLAGLLAFFLLLLVTDINFVWRSTLLSAGDLIPILQWLSTPWGFWSTAQPSLELLQLTQDSRMAPRSITFSAYSQWWQFILALQIFYSFIPRGILLIVSQIALARRISRAEEHNLTNPHPGYCESEEQEISAPIVTRLNEDCVLVNWGTVSRGIVEMLQRQLATRIIGRLEAGPAASDDQQSSAEKSNHRQLILVKSWEPPLAELADYLRHSRGYILPLDWEQSELKVIDLFHLQEWRRFAATLPDWKIYLLPQFMPDGLTEVEAEKTPEAQE